MARFQRTLAFVSFDGDFYGLCNLNQYVMGARGIKYRYGGLVVEVKKIVDVTEYVGKFQCFVRGYGHGNHEPKKMYTVESETNAKASRIALQMYNLDFNRNGTNG